MSFFGSVWGGIKDGASWVGGKVKEIAGGQDLGGLPGGAGPTSPTGPTSFPTTGGYPYPTTPPLNEGGGTGGLDEDDGWARRALGGLTDLVGSIRDKVGEAIAGDDEDGAVSGPVGSGSLPKWFAPGVIVAGIWYIISGGRGGRSLF